MMSLNKKQWAGVAIMLGGLATLPVVFASRNSSELTENPNVIYQMKNSTLAQGTGYISNDNGSGVTVINNDRLAQLANQRASSSGNFSPNARMQPRDYPATEWQAQSNSTTVQNVGYSQSANCEYYGEAGRLGIYHFRFPEANEATDLETVNGYKVNKMAAGSLRKMIADARSQGVTLTLGSAFRSVEYQRGIVQRKKAAGQSARQIYYVSSQPGFSEHHTGLAVDFSPINHGFAKTAGFSWLENHAKDYGFEKTFTSNYSRATGVSEESWHWKYTGSAQAKAMLANSQCYLKPKSNWHASS